MKGGRKNSIDFYSDSIGALGGAHGVSRGNHSKTQGCGTVESHPDMEPKVMQVLWAERAGKEALGVTGSPRVSPPQLAAPRWREPQQSTANKEDASPLDCWSPEKQKSIFCLSPNRFILSFQKGTDCSAVSRSVKHRAKKLRWEWAQI